MSYSSLNNRVALVTGANNPRGIGAAVARGLIEQGVRVFLTYWRTPFEGEVSDTPGEAFYRSSNARDASAVVMELRAMGGQAEALEVDLSDPAQISPLFDAVERTFGPVEILVNNAAHSTADTFVPAAGELANSDSVQWLSSDVPTLTAASHDAHFAVNARAVALMMTEFARRHLVRGATWGRIINFSTGGADCFPSEIAYGASKAALESYSRSAAVELGKYGITVNIVSPGPTQTGWMTPEMEAMMVRGNPIPRVGLPEDVADVVVFLASEQARWLTGQTLQVGGGHRM
ncbi:MAG: SDR family oxidoreductase [bacterium]|nr:SDR family oxidoreductase [bacterium]